MATPLSLQEDWKPEFPSGMGASDSVSATTSLRKRNRQALEESLDESEAGWDFPDDGRPKTRRVNPQRLAIRLGPALVAEMEALIVPGAKMPTFAVRKDFQERYQVDRRHIYDYFHSRGLRVAKEDKHTNLIRGRAMKVQAQLRACPVEDSAPSVGQGISHCDISNSMPLSVSVTSTNAKPRGRAVRKQAKHLNHKQRATRGPSISSNAGVLGPDFDAVLARVSSVDPDAHAGIVTSSSGTDTDWESTAPCPEFSLPCDTSDDNGDKASAVSDFLPSPDDFIAGYFDSPMQFQQPFLDLETNATDLDSFTVVDDHGFLTADERSELYNLINNNISESLDQAAETYDSYLSEKSRSRFDRLGALPRTSRTPKIVPSIMRISTCESPMSGDSPDIRKWLADEFDSNQLALSVHDYHSIYGSFDDVSLPNGYVASTETYYSDSEGVQPLPMRNFPLLEDSTSRYMS